MNADLEQLIADYLERKEAKEKLERDISDISEQILSRMAEGESAEIAPGQGVRIQRPSRKFDPAVAQQILTGEQWAAILVPVPNSQRAKDILPGALYEQCTRLSGQPTVRAI
jgi:hypothetical protein